MLSNPRITLIQHSLWLAAWLALLITPVGRAQEKPYFVTYSHDLEEPGNLEIETKSAVAQPNGDNPFGATAMELEYGTRAWWTTELYLDGQATGSDSAVFTGWRLENRIRPLMRDHAVNPVFYVEYENISGADKTILEFVGHDGQSDLAPPNADPAPRPSARGRAEADSLLQHARTGTSPKISSPKKTSAMPPGSSATPSEPRALCAARPAAGNVPSARRSSSPAPRPTAAWETPSP